MFRQLTSPVVTFTALVARRQVARFPDEEQPMASSNSHLVLTLKRAQLIDFLLELSLSASPLGNENR
jgi:hypothetical protein